MEQDTACGDCAANERPVGRAVWRSPLQQHGLGSALRYRDIKYFFLIKWPKGL